jgi:FKBP-type peptidyl-prolyl cis-trans isomerase
MKKLIYLVVFLQLFALKLKAQDNFQRSPRGAAYQILTHNTGDKIKIDDVITIDVIQKTEKDSVLFDSHGRPEPLKLQVQTPTNVGDLMEIFPLMTVKDSAIVKVPTDSVFKSHEDQRPAFLPKGSQLIFLIKVNRVQSLNDAIAERNAAIAERKAELDKVKASEGIDAAKYIADHQLVLKTTPSGLKYVITHPSLKRKPLVGDTLLVNYTGRTLAGKVFDSSIESEAVKGGLHQPGRVYEPIKLVVGSGQVIKGWDEGLLLVNEGAKAMFIIPSSLAYGDQNAGEDIKPYSTLIFDVELVKIIPGKHPVTKPLAKKTLPKKHRISHTKN